MRSNIEDLYKKRIHVKEYNDTPIDHNMIKDLLKKAYELVPSKQLIVPYKIEVLGPDREEEKKIFQNFCMNETGKNSPMAPVKKRKSVGGTLQLDAPYVLLFTTRKIQDYNDAVRRMLEKKGQGFNAIRVPHHVTNTFFVEIGMFAMTLTGLCLEKGLGTSYSMCMPSRHATSWKNINHIIKAPLVSFAMSIGYTDQELPYWTRTGENLKEKKPPIENVIKF
tara:strand:+ start:140 stop:805 length:666 start_codon:yes stop_codon:yes gene_type:complete